MITWLLAWDDIGLEAVVNVSRLEQEYVYNALTNEPATDKRISLINHVTLRARFNSHRHYEVWMLNADDEIDREQFEWGFEVNPDTFKSLVRSKGVKVY